MRKVEKTKLISRVMDEAYIPWLVLWDLTYACQLRCSHCYQMNLDRSRKLELPTHRILKTLEEMRDMGTQELVFSGGDPFLRRDFLNIIKYTGENGFHVGIFSSGVMIKPEVAKSLKAFRVSWVEVTIMGADAYTHDEITGSRGSFKLLFQSVVNLRDAGVAVIGKTVITKKNFPQIEAIKDLCRKFEAQYRFDPHLWRPWNGEENQIIDLKLGTDNFREFYDLYQPPEPQKENYIVSGNMCNAGRQRVGITPSGKVNPCTTYGEHMVIGDLQTHTFKEIWNNSPLLEQYRTTNFSSYPKCLSCQMTAFCDWCPGMSGWVGNQSNEPYEELCKDTKIKMILWEEKNNKKWIQETLQSKTAVSA